MEMLKLLITAQQWDEMDQWTCYTLPAIFIFGGIIVLFVGLIPFVYSQNKITKILFSISLVLGISVGILVYVKNLGLKEYNQESSYITAQSREYQAEMFGVKTYDENEVRMWRYENDWQSLSKLSSIFKRSSVKEKIIYLGQANESAFIKINDKRLKISLRDCKKSNENYAYITGYKFIMRDSNFEKLGFIKQPYYFAKNILIPKSQWNKKAPEGVVNNYDTPKVAGKWIVDSEK